MIEVKNLTKRYGDNVAVNDISFTVEKGKIYGFLGPNGAGKSTTMNIITGCLAASEGTVEIDGLDIFEDAKEAKAKIGYLPELPPVYGDMTPEEYLKFVASAKGLKIADAREQIEYVMGVTGIDKVSKRLIQNLSKGYKQRVGIAQAMLGNPEIIILDEPTVGLDPMQIIEIRQLIKKLGEDHTVILSSHILPEVAAVCDYVMIISHGRLVAQDSLENLSNSLTGDHRIDLDVRGDENKIRMALNELEGIKEYEIEQSKDEDGVCKITVKTSPEDDLRDAIFFKFASLGYPILNMVNEIITLEDVFLRLTADSDEEDESFVAHEDLDVEFEDDDETYDEDDTDDNYDDDDEEDIVPLTKKDKKDKKDDNGEYKSLFS